MKCEIGIFVLSCSEGCNIQKSCKLNDRENGLSHKTIRWVLFGVFCVVVWWWFVLVFFLLNSNWKTSIWTFKG